MIAIAKDIDRMFGANSTNYFDTSFIPAVFLVLREFRINFMSLEVICTAEGEAFQNLNEYLQKGNMAFSHYFPF